jgi:hypothetical protein
MVACFVDDNAATSTAARATPVVQQRNNPFTWWLLQDAAAATLNASTPQEPIGYARHNVPIKPIQSHNHTHYLPRQQLCTTAVHVHAQL